MSQTNKLFLVLLVLFLVYSTLKGTLAVYLRTLFGPACKSSGSSSGGGGSSFGNIGDVAGQALAAAAFL